MLFSVALQASHYTFSSPSDPLSARQSSVYHIAQDSAGFIWFASDTDGLLRYDGLTSINWLEPDVRRGSRKNTNNFLLTAKGDLWVASWREGLLYYPHNQDMPFVFPIKPNDPHALSTPRIQTLFQDSQQRIWVGTIAGLYVIYPENPLVLHRYAFDEPTHPLFEQRIWGIAESPTGLWFATSNGLFLLDPQHNQYQQFFLPDTEHAISERAQEVRTVEFIDHTVWAGAANGVFVFETACMCFVRIAAPDNLPQPRVNALHRGTNHALWVGAFDGLYQLNSQTRQWTLFSLGYNTLPDVDIRSIYLDSADQLWLGSREQGFFIGTPQYKGFIPLVHTMPATVASLGERLISAIYHDKQGRMWLAAQNNLLYRDANTEDWHAIELRKQFGIRKVFRITADPTGQLWLATDRGLYQLQQNTLVAVNTPFDLANMHVGGVTELYISDAGHFYLGVWQQGLLVWQPELQHAQLELAQLKETNGDQIYQLGKSTDGSTFAVTRYSGVFSQPQPNAPWQRLQINNQNAVDGYTCVLPEGDQILWLCSEFGLWRYDRATQRVSQYAIEQGLPSLFISGAFFDHSQQLWIMTNNGIARFDQSLQRFVSYGKHDGLPNLTTQQKSYSVGPAGEVLFGTAAGAVLIAIHPEYENFQAPRLVIAKVVIDGTDQTKTYQAYPETIELPYGYRELVIGYALVDYRDPALNTTRSRLLGFSDRWSPYDKSHEARYSNLAPGRYVLEIEGQNSRGVGTERPLRINIVVNAPWWYASWLWFMIILLGLMLVLVFMRVQQNRLKNRNKRLQKLVQERTSELEALTVKLKDRADHDVLTGLYNRGGFVEQFEQSLTHARMRHYPMSMVLIDIDHFKQINDQYGHNIGDSVLQHFSSLIASQAKKTDIIGRWGGEEFIMALPHADAQAAKAFCDTLLNTLKASPFTQAEHHIAYSATFGVVCLPTTTWLVDTWVKLADDALYRGKHQGRAQVVLADTQA
ncbi:hypothetical protein GCM10008111_12040 [Alishewanella tabrizica]|uniref:diguanylate cyclase n=2 Tax=Alishewanella tabrizica TaxID=671278 RepID=A0ABQ2WIY7_9ALTE|nr:hypothetical protein GCM10008111_12040 [Alishewanella tabrizica]